MLVKLFFLFTKIGIFTIGGGYAVIPLIEKEIISRSWLAHDEFYELLAITESLPGVFATNIAAGRYHAPVIEKSPYEDVYKMSLEMMNEHVDDGGDPIEMAQAIYKIIQTPKPKVRYVIGAPMQKFSLFLKKILPGKTYEKLLMNHYKIKG